MPMIWDSESPSRFPRTSNPLGQSPDAAYSAQPYLAPRHSKCKCGIKPSAPNPARAGDLLIEGMPPRLFEHPDLFGQQAARPVDSVRPDLGGIAISVNIGNGLEI